MPVDLRYVQTQDVYEVNGVEVCGIGPLDADCTAFFSVLGAPVLCQTVKFDLSTAPAWDRSEIAYDPNSMIGPIPHIGGLRFKSLLSGNPATIRASLYLPGDPVPSTIQAIPNAQDLLGNLSFNPTVFFANTINVPNPTGAVIISGNAPGNGIWLRNQRFLVIRALPNITGGNVQLSVQFFDSQGNQAGTYTLVYQNFPITTFVMPCIGTSFNIIGVAAAAGSTMGIVIWQTDNKDGPIVQQQFGHIGGGNSGSVVAGGTSPNLNINGSWWGRSFVAINGSQAGFAYRILSFDYLGTLVGRSAAFFSSGTDDCREIFLPPCVNKIIFNNQGAAAASYNYDVWACQGRYDD